LCYGLLPSALSAGGAGYGGARPSTGQSPHRARSRGQRLGRPVDALGLGGAVKRGWFDPAVVFAAVLAVYLAVTPRTNQAYRHFVYMAQGFLQGRGDVPRAPPHSHERIPLQGRSDA